MWAAWVIAAIALAGAAFMLRFMMALLREGAPSVCYWGRISKSYCSSAKNTRLWQQAIISVFCPSVSAIPAKHC